MTLPTTPALPPESETQAFLRVRAALIVLVVGVGASAAAVSWHLGDQSAARDDRAVARRAVVFLEGATDTIQVGLAGASGLVQGDGMVDVDAFARYGQEVADHSTVAALAYEPVVPARARGAFERDLGRPIVDRTPGGGVLPAPARPEHFPVRAVMPVSETTRQLLGFDLAGDPDRKEAAERARDSGAVVFTHPIASQPSGTVSVFIVKPLYRRGLPVETTAERRAAIAGFISTASVGPALTDSLAAALPDGTRFELRDGQARLATSALRPGRTVEETIRAANRTWTLVVDGPAIADHGPAVLLGALTLLVAGGLGYVWVSAHRHARELRRSAGLIARTALLAQALAGARTEDQVVEVLHDQLPMVFGTPSEGAATSIGLIDGEVLRVKHGPTVPEEYRERFGAPPLASDLAFTEAARTGATLLFETQEDYDVRYPRADGPRLGARAVLPLRRADGTMIGSIAHVWSSAQVFDDPLRATLSTIAQLTGQAVERARLAKVQDDDARHAKGLSRLAQGLTSRTNSDAVMAFLTQGVLAPLDAFHAAVGVVEGSVLRRHFSPGQIGEVMAERGFEVTPISTDSPLTQSVRLGEPVYLADPDQLRRRYPHLAEHWSAVGFGATANLPLRDRKGAVIGALGIAWSHSVVFDNDLLDRLSTVAGIAGQTLERAQLVDRIRAEARNSEAFAELAEVLATARSVADVTDAVEAQAAPAAGADGVEIAILDPATGQLLLADGSPVVAPHPYLDVVRDGGTLTFPGRAVSALRDASGHRVGALGFHWSTSSPLDKSRLTTLRYVADLCSQALERAQLSDAEHRLVGNLQGSVLAPFPPGEGLVTAARYLPAARSVGMGGDWYEGIVLPDGRYVVVVGDVAGHGITAVGQMAQFRSVIGSLIRIGTPLEDLFNLATSVVQGIDPIASAVVAEIDLRAGGVRYAAAGHPPPLLRSPDGTVTLLEGGRQALLGVDMPSRAVGEHAFPPGATLLCYTDGLIERRGEAIDESIARLAQVVVERSLPRPGAALDPQALADELLRVCLSDRESTDDVAVALITRDLEVRRASHTGGEPSGFDRSVAG